MREIVDIGKIESVKENGVLAKPWRTLSLFFLATMSLTILMTALLVLPRKTSAEAEITDVDIGARATAIAYNPVTNKIYTANSAAGTVTVIDGATYKMTTTVTVGTLPSAIAVNPETNKIYVVNSGSNMVTVIDGSDHTKSDVLVGVSPGAIAVNMATNKIYVANTGSNTVSILDGTNHTTTVPVGSGPRAITVNQVTNKIYVANYADDTVTAIDGTNDTASAPIPVGDGPQAVAANPVTNKIYVVNNLSDSVTAIDGLTGATTPIPTGDSPLSAVVNPITNKIYVSNQESGSVTVIDGVDNGTAAIVTGGKAKALAINPVTNKIYVDYASGARLISIDGTTHTTTSVLVGQITAMVVNPVTNMIYAGSFDSNKVIVIDGSGYSNSTISAGTMTGAPVAVAHNPVTNKIYFSRENGSEVVVIDALSQSSSTFPTEAEVTALAVNPATNKIYAAMESENRVDVFDGSTHARTARVATGDSPSAIAVNSVTDKIYVVNRDSDNVTIIDGPTDTASTVAAGVEPSVVAVNPVTNKIYVGNFVGQSVTVIDGKSSTVVRTIPINRGPVSFAVFPESNLIYSMAVNAAGSGITLIDGATDTIDLGRSSGAPGITFHKMVYDADKGSIYYTSDNPMIGYRNLSPYRSGTIGHSSLGIPNVIGISPRTGKLFIGFPSASLTVKDTDGDDFPTVFSSGIGIVPGIIESNTATNRTFIPSADSNDIVIVDVAERTVNPLQVSVTPLAGNVAYGTEETFRFQTTDSRPGVPPVQSVYYQLDSVEGEWTKASPDGSDWTATLSSLSKGQHELYVMAIDAHDGAVSAGVANAYAFTVMPEDSEIGPTSGGFDRYAGSAGYRDVGTTLTLYGHTLSGIANGAAALVEGTDYSVLGDRVTISKEYLATQPVGTTTLTFAFSAGAPQTLTITVSDSTPPSPVDSAISPTSGVFDLYAASATHTDVTTTATLNGNTLDGIANGATPLTAGTDYDYDAASGTVTILRSYLAAQPVGTTTLTFAFSAGAPQTLTITVSDSTPPSPVDSAISPTSGVFDLYEASATHTDVTTTATLNGNTLTGIANGATPLASVTDYVYNAGSGTVTILRAYLATQPVGTTTLTFAFSAGASQTLTIAISNSTPTPSTPSPTSPSGPAPVEKPKFEILPDPSGGILIKVDPSETEKTTASDGTSTETLTLPDDVIDRAIEALKKADKPFITIKLDNTGQAVRLSLTGNSFAALVRSFPEAVVEAELNGSSFQLQASVLDLDSLAKRLGVETFDLRISYLMEIVGGTVKQDFLNLGKKQGFALRGDAVDFKILIEANGKAVEIREFGGKYMIRAIVFDGGTTGRHVFAVYYDPTARTVSYIPTRTGKRGDGKTQAVMQSRHNSIYAIVETGGISFGDLSGHWAKADVESLASKLIVSGISADRFGPDLEITRAEFAAMLVRSLGLSTERDSTNAGFSDVDPNAWYAPFLEAANRSGLVQGSSPDRLAPNERISREQMAVMIARAYALAAGDQLPPADDRALASYKDRNEISKWAQEAMARSVAAGILNGTGGSRIGPSDEATRAQAAAMLKRLLQDVGLME